MSPELIFNLVVVIGALVVIPTSRLRYGTWLTSGFLYSFGWLCVIFFYRYLDLTMEGGYEIPLSSFEFGTKLVFWGYVGVLLAHLFFGAPRMRYREFSGYFSLMDAFLKKYYLWICGFVFALGTIAFLQRVSTTGVSIYMLADLRHDHVHSRFGGFQRLSIYGSLILNIFIILSAVNDNIREKVNARRIIAIIIAVLPLALSKGSRQEFMTPVISYMLTTFLVVQLRLISGHKIKWGLLWRIYSKFLPLFLALLFVFTIFGQLRMMSSKKMSGQYDLFSLVDAPKELTITISGWLVSSFYSVGPITKFEDTTFPRMQGRICFEPIFKVPEKLGLIPDKNVLVYLARQAAFNEFKTAQFAYTPGTMGKILTREVGRDLAPYFGALAMFVVVGISNFWKRTSIFGFVVVFVFSSQALMSFQSLRGLSMLVAWQLFFAFLFTYFYARFQRLHGTGLPR